MTGENETPTYFLLCDCDKNKNKVHIIFTYKRGDFAIKMVQHVQRKMCTVVWEQQFTRK